MASGVFASAGRYSAMTESAESFWAGEEHKNKKTEAKASEK